MNERIKQLAEQSGIVFWEMSGDVDWRQTDKETLAKFAELIVRECSNFLKDTLDDHFAAEQLEEHFGVQE